MLFLSVHSSTGTFQIFFLSTVDSRTKVLYNKYLHDANDNDICSATSLAQPISVRDGLSSVSCSDGSKFTRDNVSDFVVYIALL